MWYLGWFWHAIANGENPFFSTLVNYPHGLNMIANTSIMAASAIFGPTMYLVNAVFAFNTMVSISLLLSGLLGFQLLRTLRIRTWIAMLGGILFEICPFLINQLVDGHINFSLSMPLMLGILTILVRVLREGSSRRNWLAILCGILLAVQFYTSLELFATFFFTLGITFVAAVIIDWELVKHILLQRRNLNFYIITAVCMLLLVIPGIALFLNAVNQSGLSSGYMPADRWITDLFNLWTPTQAQLVHTKASIRITEKFTANLSEMDGYLGLPLVVSLVLCMWVLRRKRWAWTILIAGCTAVLLSFGPASACFRS